MPMGNISNNHIWTGGPSVGVQGTSFGGYQYSATGVVNDFDVLIDFFSRFEENDILLERNDRIHLLRPVAEIEFLEDANGLNIINGSIVKYNDKIYYMTSWIGKDQFMNSKEKVKALNDLIEKIRIKQPELFI